VTPVHDEAWMVVCALAFVWCGVFASHFLRYLLSCGVVELSVRYLPGPRARPLRAVDPSDAQRSMEFRASLEAGAIFALQFLPLVYLVPRGWTQLYFDVDDYGWAYYVASLLLALIIHDAYFYWTHRWMHRPVVFKRVHAHHHRSIAPTPWTSFSFHALESIVQGGIHLLLPLAIPLHVSALGAFVLWTNLYGALLHCGHDVFPPQWRAGLRWLNTALEHEAHHGGARGNFGLYFSFWDRVCGTYAEPRARCHADTPRPRLTDTD
jgi:lathosterol oxidase